MASEQGLSRRATAGDWRIRECGQRCLCGKGAGLESLRRPRKQALADLSFEHLEWRVATHQAEELAEDAIMIETIAGTNGGFAGSEGIPRYGGTRFDVFPVVLVERSSSGTFSRLCKREGALPVGGNQQRRHAVLDFDRHAKEFVADAVTESQIRNNFVRVLGVESKFALPEAAFVRGCACAASIKELRLCQQVYATKKLPDQILQVHARLHLLR